METKKEQGVHALLISNSGKVLLVTKGSDYKYDKSNAGKISMFGGKVEEGEDILGSLKRELIEELGLDISSKEIKKLNVYQKTKEQDGVDVDVHIFVVKGIDGSVLKINEEDPDVVKDLDSNESIIEEEANELLKYPNLTRITRLALQDFILI